MYFFIFVFILMIVVYISKVKVNEEQPIKMVWPLYHDENGNLLPNQPMPPKGHPTVNVPSY